MSTADNLKLKNNTLKSQINTIVNITKNHGAILDEHEQYLRRECIEIKGIPENEEEDTNDIVSQVAELMDIQVEDADISVSHRLPPGKPWTDNNGILHQPDPPIIIADKSNSAS